MSTVNELPFDEDEVLVRFAQAERPDLTEWMRRYPAQARDLARFAADRWSDRADTSPDAVAVTRVREIGLEVVRARRKTTAGAIGVNGLMAAAAGRGLDAASVAAALDIPYALFVKLHRRLIAPESIPEKFLKALAETIGRQAEEISAYLRQPPTLANQYFRADQKPIVSDPETFADALRDDPESTDEQRNRWLA
ncbi:MAG: hypothetical protein SFU56_01725 [Capsulimonadales bacterium]|nr:hypothetical protein [Capsulimonadales bacterium]